MSAAYDLYLKQHRENVWKGFLWIRENLPILIHDSQEFGGTINYDWQIQTSHDYSKDDPLEYNAYDAYFYGNNRSHAVVQRFNYAWLMHIHRNGHHWQHWVLINDDPGEGETVLEMPHNCVIEMICDWWAFSWGKGNLYEIFDWYAAHKDYIKLHPKSRDYVDYALEQIKSALDAQGGK